MAMRIPTPKLIPAPKRDDPAAIIERLHRELKHEGVSPAEHRAVYSVVLHAPIDAAALVCRAPDGETRWRLDIVRWPKTGKLVGEVSLWHGYTDVAYVVTRREGEALDRANVASGGGIWFALQRWEPELVNGSLMNMLNPHVDEEGVDPAA